MSDTIIALPRQSHIYSHPGISKTYSSMVTDNKI